MPYKTTLLSGKVFFVVEVLFLPRRRFSAPTHSFFTPLFFFLFPEMDSLFRKSKLDGIAEFDMLWEAVMEHTKLMRIVMYRNLLEYPSLKASVFSYVLAEKSFSLDLAEKYLLQRELLNTLAFPNVGLRAGSTLWLLSSRTIRVSSRILEQSQFPTSSGLREKSTRTARSPIASLRTFLGTSTGRRHAHPVPSSDVPSSAL